MPIRHRGLTEGAENVNVKSVTVETAKLHRLRER